LAISSSRHREVDAIVHVLRCFETRRHHVEGRIDLYRPETVETELMLPIWESLDDACGTREKVKAARRKQAAAGADDESDRRYCKTGKPSAHAVLTAEEREPYRSLGS